MDEAVSSTQSSDFLDELSKSEDHCQIKTILEDDNAAFVILLKTFEYLMVPDLLNVSQVSKLWNFVSCHDLLWKRVSLKNCYLTDYDGLFKKMLKHRTQELVIEDTALFIPDGVNNLKELEDCLPSSLKFLKLGDCYSLSSNFTTNTIPTLINLNRLELENGLSRFQTNDLLNVIAVMPNVTHLSLINMDITSGFRESLSRCTYLQSLHISPYCSHDLDSLSVHQRIIYSVDTLKDSLKSFNLGFDCRFLDVPNCIDDQMVQVLTWNRPTREDDISISFVNTECSCVQPCPYLLHIIMVPIDVIEKELFPECLPKTKAWITKSGLLGIYPDGKRGCVSGGDYSEKFKVVRLSFYHEFYTFCKYW
ncbi:uncharacterized protein [Halyomorpha halys]|uniref:uncharacterized protein isoform X2 n=1 Tax=Halyomorpha halys TaxID=286706 RepID=UPI0006D4DED2|nr:lysine-specific demethylase 2B-like isoform X3 [Halyomorpha halys]